MERIEERFKLSPHNTKRINDLRKIITDIWNKSRDYINEQYTPHDQTHSCEIEGLLVKLLYTHCNNRDVLEEFADDEKFVLIASAWLHDIGMCPQIEELGDKMNVPPEEIDDSRIRKTHNERSALFIKKSLALRNLLTNEEKDRLATICQYHRKAEQIPVDLYDKVRLIIAFLRLADALHIPDRAPLNKLRTYIARGMDPVSKYHWLKSFYIVFAGPVKDDPNKLVIKFKSPSKWNGNTKRELKPLEDILRTELADELDTVKDILFYGNKKYGLPAYIKVDIDYDVTYLDPDEISDLKELLGIIELFNPTISPNSGRVIEIVLNQIERCLEEGDQKEIINSIKNYTENTLKPLLNERPCHAYLRHILELLEQKIIELKQSTQTQQEREKQKTEIDWMTDLQEKVRALKWWRKEFARQLPLQVLDSHIFQDENDSIILYGYSGSVIQALLAIDEDTRKDIDVFVCECATKNKHRYNNRLVYNDGIHYVRELNDIGIKNIRYVPDVCISNLLARQTSNSKKRFKVLFGANGIDTKTREIIHALGHLAIADMAECYEIPAYVIAEGLKLKPNLPKSPDKDREDPWFPTDIDFDDIDSENSKNPREDVVPLTKIEAVLTENGVWSSKKEFNLDRLATTPDEVFKAYQDRYKTSRSTTARIKDVEVPA